MGLDGISINQLRIQNSIDKSEILNSTRESVKKDEKSVSGLNQEQVINPDEGNQENKKEQDEKKEFEEEQEEIINFDLSDSSKYEIKLDETQNQLLIIEKQTGKILQVVNPEKLARFVGLLANSTGSIVNRKF